MYEDDILEMLWEDRSWIPEDDDPYENPEDDDLYDTEE